MLLEKAGTLFKSEDLKKKAKTMNKLNQNLFKMYELFDFFVANNWVYENKLIYSIMDGMVPEERALFICNPMSFHWRDGIRIFVFGLQKFVLKQDVSLSFENGQQ